jgi:hypothetical protein
VLSGRGDFPKKSIKFPNGGLHLLCHPIRYRATQEILPMKEMAGTLRGLLDEGGIAYKQNPKSFILRCPHCSKKDKLYIRKNDGRFVCWYCRDIDGFEGRPEFVLKALLDKSLSEIKEELYGNNTIVPHLYLDIQIADFFEDEEETLDIYQDQEILPDPGFRDIDTDAGREGREYLIKRGIPLDIALQYDIKYHPQQSRVIFPIQSNGKWLGWQARYVHDTNWIDEEGTAISVPKVLTSFGTKRDRVLMFGDRIQSNHVVLTEGPVSAIHCHLCGGNVATLGKAISKYQMRLLQNSGIENVYLGLDPDAFREASNLVKNYPDFNFYDLRPPAPYGDLGDMPMEEVLYLFKNARKIDKSFLFLYLKDHYEKK